MHGSWRVFRTGERWSKPGAAGVAVLRTDTLVAVQFNGPVLELLRPGALALHPVLARLGPDVLDPRSIPHTRRGEALAASEDRAVAEVLLDQRVACGIGNIAKSEALWACRTDPFALPGTVGFERLAEIYDAGRVWLTAAVQRGGDAPRRIYGRPACPRCGTRSARQAQGDDGRTTWWCPGCQSG